MGFIVHTLVSAALLFFVGRMVDGIEVRDAKAAIVGALVLGLVNWIIWTVLAGLTLPLTFLTLGLFAFAANAVALNATAAIVRGFEVANFRAALKGTVVLWLMNFLVGMLIGI